MFYFEYDSTDYSKLLTEYAGKMGTTVENGNVLHFPKAFADGYYKAVILPKGLQAMILNVTFNQDFYINRKKAIEDFFIIRFDEISVKENITVRFGKEYFSDNEGVRSTALLTNASADFGYILRKGTSLRGINVLITRSCMENCLGIDIASNFSNGYLSFKSANLNFEPIDSEYRKLINEIMIEEGQNNPLKTIFIQNRIMLLVERFFTRLFKRIETTKVESKFDDKEIEKLMIAEAKLIENISEPAPSVSELARITHMSETKFKTKFKKVYGYSPYDYYQRTKMFHAKNLLVTQKYSVKEVGINLGFRNLSNFTIAFKKVFGILPSELASL